MSHPNSPHTSPRKGKYIPTKVYLLDDSIQVFQVPHRCLGVVLFNEVIHKLQLLEADYFDLEFSDPQGNTCWLDHEKPLLKQVSVHDLNFKFLVKFYTPDPGLLEEEYTRYLFALQVRRDLSTGSMPCQEHTAVLLASYVVQAEIGDFIEDEYNDHTYLSGLKLLPGQTEDVEIKIMEHHKEHIGQTPAEADFNLLDTARKVELYGIRMHTGRDHEGVLLNLAVAHMGVLVFQQITKINTFSWAKIRKLSFKRKKFLIKLHPEGYDFSSPIFQGYYKDTVEFYFESRNECKNFWKKCIEHHAFFRCHSVKRIPRNKTRVVSRGSSFRYCGKTQKQLTEYVRDNFTKRPPFERSQSLRTVSGTRSHGATPNTSTLNSRDIHFTHNTSTSSGSHTLDLTARDGVDATRVEMAEVHDDSSQSGSRSINSPKKDRDRDFSMAPSGSEEWNHEDMNEEEEEEKGDRLIQEPEVNMYVERSPRAHRIDPTQFMLSKENRKMSAPVFSNIKPPEMEEKHLSRSPEIDNIPERVHDMRDEQIRQLRDAPRSPGLRSTAARPAPLPMRKSKDSNAKYMFDEPYQKPKPPSPRLHRTRYAVREPPSGGREASPGDGHVRIPLRETPSPVSGRSSREVPPSPVSSGGLSPHYTRNTPPPIGKNYSREMTPEGRRDRDNQFLFSHNLNFGQEVEKEIPEPFPKRSLRLASESPHLERMLANIGKEEEEVDRASSPNLRRMQSAGMMEPPPYEQVQGNMMNISITEEPLPPPPPPIYQEETPRERALKVNGAKERREEMRQAAASRSTTSAASITLTSSASITSSRGTDESEEEGRRKRFPADKAYYIAKELLMTERTYKKDLEVITVSFRKAVTKEDVLPEPLGYLLFTNLDPIYDFHNSFLKEIEQRLAMWEGKSNAHLNGDYQRIGDIMLNNMKVLQLYRNYIEHHEEILNEMEAATRRNKRFEQVYKDFESQKVCYLPLNTFLLKPAQRLLHYQLILERLLNHYTVDHPDYRDCKMSLNKICEVTSSFAEQMRHLENLQKMIELQRDLVGIDSLVISNREFIREGCLQKLSKKGYQQRMFFLFSDMLVYASRTATPSLQFKVHGQLPLRGMIVEQTDAVANSFTIYGGNKCLPLAAGSGEEKDKWSADLEVYIALAKDRGEDKVLYPSLKSNSSSDNLEDSHEEVKTPPSPEKQIQHRANTTMHVCWHRNTSVSMRDHSVAIENQLSGYLLRKFKNSNGWQKLWVVFTNFCLFFYKTFQDDFPLASLPLLGYSVMTPTEADGIHKDYVFKLQFKNHVYFFRAESEYTFERWVEVIGSATDNSK